jgi:hypothetical protein
MQATFPNNAVISDSEPPSWACVAYRMLEGILEDFRERRVVSNTILDYNFCGSFTETAYQQFSLTTTPSPWLTARPARDERQGSFTASALDRIEDNYGTHGDRIIYDTPEILR